MRADYEVIPCDKIVLKVLPNGNIFKSYKKNVENLWNADPLVNDGTVFDGNLLMLKEIDQVSLTEINILCNFTGYKNFYISRKYKNIPFDIQPIGVSGIILFKDSKGKLYTVIGKRSASVSNYPKYYELLPSGNVDDAYLNSDLSSIDYEKNLITEFQEESGLNPSSIKKINLIGLIHDRKENYYDIICEIILKDFYAQVAKKLNLNNEYEKIFFLSVDELENFLFNEQDYLVPASAGLIEYAVKKFL